MTASRYFPRAHEHARETLNRHRAGDGRVRVTAMSHPALHEAFEIISHDGGSGAGHADYWVPARWAAGLDEVETALEGLLESGPEDDLQTLCIGEDRDMRAIAGRSTALTRASCLFADFFNDWVSA